MKVLLIGCGYLGHTVDDILKNKNSVTVTRTQTPCPLQGVHFELLRPSLFSKISHLVNQFDVFIITAAPSSSLDYPSTYLILARKLQKALKDLSGKTLIYTSSTGVYAEMNGHLINETAPLDLDRSHILINTEKTYLSLVSHRIVIARLSGLTGSLRPLSKMYERYLHQAMPKRMANFIDVKNAAHFIQYALYHPIRGVFNCSTLTDLNVNIFQKIYKKSPQIADGPKKFVHGGSKQIDSRKVLSDAGFRWLAIKPE